MYDNAWSKVWKVFQEKAEKNGTLAKKAPTFLVPRQRYQTFQNILENLKLVLINGFPITAIPA